MKVTLSTAEPRRHAEPTARAIELTHLVFERPDLSRAEAFLRDFGLTVVTRTDDVLLLRGTAPSAYGYRVHRAGKARFVGLGLAVASRDELLRLSRLAGATPIAPATYPGGGEQTVLSDPSGFVVEVLHGRQSAEELPTREPLALNVGKVARRINHGQRPPVVPPAVIRLGHVALEVADYQATARFYTQHLGLVPSDIQVLPDGSPAVAFLRLDRGAQPTDHHTLALVQGLEPRLNHSAYELVDADAVGMGQRVLRERGYQHAWGIGRHILGSQIFDYWSDEHGDKHEHYCDGDLFTADTPPGVSAVSREAMAQWGQPMPSSFTRPSLSLRALLAAARNLRRSPDLSLEKVLTLARLFG
ncbi:MAG: VOC family protein [Sandaracinaceae bacterium]|nr:VOC family protein [Sandaracinaceae bacterium]